MTQTITLNNTLAHSLQHCSNCSLNSLCMAVSLDMSEMSKLDDIIDRGKPLQKGHYLSMQGDEFSCVFTIKAGSVKTFTTSPSGEQHITGFYFPGDLIGLNALHTGVCQDTIQVLETSTVCKIPFEQLDKLSEDLPNLRRQILKSMSKEICQEQHMLELLARKTANQRLATFLLQLAQMYKSRGFSELRFRLPMSRNDIANFLGLTVETVSRELTKMDKLGYISVENKEISISDIQRLANLSQGTE